MAAISFDVPEKSRPKNNFLQLRFSRPYGLMPIISTVGNLPKDANCQADSLLVLVALAARLDVLLMGAATG